MTGLVHAREMLAQLEPADVEAYLRGTGWGPGEGAPGRVSYWRRASERTGEEFQVACLLDKKYRDFPDRMAELLEAVSFLEGRTPEEVHQSIAQVACDVAELQIEREDITDNGDIPLKAGAAAFHGAVRLYAAAAAAELERKPYYGTLLAGKVNEFLENVRLGQTRRGSYVITIATHLPTDPAQVQPDLPLRGLPPREPPFERRVMLRLATALQVAHGAAVENVEAAFRRGVQHGVSADLCDAIGKMAEGNAFQRLNLRLRWSWLQPVPPTVPRNLSFGPELVRNLREGAAHLRFRKQQTDFPLLGKVVRLERFPEEEAGTVGILGFVGSEAESVSVHLTKDDYRRATEAHTSEKTVVCIGALKRTGRGYALLQARGFRVVDGPYEIRDEPGVAQAAEPPLLYGTPTLPSRKRPKRPGRKPKKTKVKAPKKKTKVKAPRKTAKPPPPGKVSPTLEHFEIQEPRASEVSQETEDETEVELVLEVVGPPGKAGLKKPPV